MNKTLVFDMDGTIANLFGVDNWEPRLRNCDPTPYAEATPIWDMEVLVAVLNVLKTLGWRIAVTSWLAMDSTKAYDDEVRIAKRNWLDNFGFPYDEIHLVKYGTTKANCTRKNGGVQILVDDNRKVRKGWTLGDTIDPTAVDLIEELLKLCLTN